MGRSSNNIYDQLVLLWFKRIYSGIKYKENDRVRLKVRHNPLLFCFVSQGTGIDLYINESFSFMASVYLESNGEGPMFHYTAPNTQWGPHSWITGNKLYTAFTSCSGQSDIYNTQMQLNTWQTVATSYDFPNNVLRLWVDGIVKVKTLPACSVGLKTSTTVYLGKHPTNHRALNGKVTCMSLYNKAMEYDDMLDATMPTCLQ